MVKMFKFMSRSDISRIRCQAHLLHLIVCNGLSLWVTQGTMNNNNDNTNAKDSEDRLSQSLKKVNITTFDDTESSCDSADEEETENNAGDFEEIANEVR